MIDFDFFKNKKVLITGHTGFKGSWLCRILNKCGAKVYGYSLDPPTNPNLYNIANIPPIVTSKIGDIADFDRLYSFFSYVKPEIVFHLAAQPIVRESYKFPLETYKTNVMGTVNILECMRLTDCVNSFLNVTTDKVYFNEESNKYFKENDSLDGFDPYSNSKSCSELVTHCYNRSFFVDKNCRISTARAGNVIGGGDFAKDRIIPDCIRSAMAHKNIELRNPNSIRPYQHVLEPLAAYITIVSEQAKYPSKAGSYNVGPRIEDCVTTGQLASLFCKYWSDDIQWVCPNCNGPHEANYLKLNSDLIHNTFGYTPHWHIDTAIQKTVQWTKSWLNNEPMDKVMDSQITEYFEGEL